MSEMVYYVTLCKLGVLLMFYCIKHNQLSGILFKKEKWSHGLLEISNQSLSI